MALNLAVLTLILLMTNTVFAQAALPGETLYNWKLASENIYRAVTVDPLGADLKFSERRVQEYMAVSQDQQRRTKVLLVYNRLLVRFQDEQAEGGRFRIQSVLKSQQDSLHRAGLTIPELDRYFSEGPMNVNGSQGQIQDISSTQPAP
jgi:hypothetical protein